jgi:hypothetical protein
MIARSLQMTVDGSGQDNVDSIAVSGGLHTSVTLGP